MSSLTRRSFTQRLVATAVLAVVVVLLLPAAAMAEEVGGENGLYSVQVYTQGAWTTVGSAAFGMQYSTRAVTLPDEATCVRIVQSGGTAAQLDSVNLSGGAPIAASGADALVVRKLAMADDDVTTLFGEALTLRYAEAGSVIEIRARIQGSLAGYLPFEYPLANLGQPVDEGSAFYAYRLSGGGNIDTAGKPFIQELTKPSTGHPDGSTFVWVADDSEGLYVVMDFTSDNTMDDDEDYATVHAKTADGVKSFTVSAGDGTWGDVAFTYTGKVDYQHKLYTFSIPWDELGGTDETVQLAFSAYGTAAYIQIPVPVHRFYRAANGAHFYTIDPAEKATIDANPSWGYTYDGLAYTLDSAHPWMRDPLHRFYNAKTRAHFFTANPQEKALVEAHPEWGFAYEGVAYTVSKEPVFMPVYRFRNKLNGVHFYTGSEDEKNGVVATLSHIYELEGIAFYIQPWQVFN